MTSLEYIDQESIQISADGGIYFLSQKVEDQNFLIQIFKNLKAKDHYFISHANDRDFVIEAFDQPLVVREIEEKKGGIVFSPIEDVEYSIQLNEIYVDDWDRFLARSEEGLPLVLTERAQNQLFDLCTFDDESITYQGVRYETPYFYQSNTSVNETSFWDAKYSDSEKPGWDLESHHPSLEVALPTLKLPKSRILVLGCGKGHDAAYFANQGHIVHALDFSSKAIENAKKLYGNYTNITWIQEDVFQFDKRGEYDLVFDHTNYCAVHPKRRQDLVKKWATFLTEKGHLLGVFFSLDKQTGPPFGGSEWELNKRIEKHFLPVYWNRLRKAPEYPRYGIEFMAYLEKKS